MQLSTHKLTNPVEGEPSDCVCGRHFKVVTLDAWKSHIAATGTPVFIIKEQTP